MPTPLNPSVPPELPVILTCIHRIRLRLYMVRLAERLTVALLLGGVLAAILLLARYLHVRYPYCAAAVAVMPVLLLGLAIPLRRTALRHVPVVDQIVSAALIAFLAAAALAVMLLHLVFPAWVIPAAVLGVLAGAAIVLSRPVSPAAAAIFVDQRAGLKERVSTAYEWATRSATPVPALESSFRKPLLQSAVDACHAVRRARIGYARLDRRVYAVTTLSLAAMIGAAALQPLPALAHRASARPNPVLAKKAQDLTKLLEELEKKQAAAGDANAAKNLDPLRNAIEELRKNPDMSQLELSAQLNQARAELERSQSQLDAGDKAHDALAKDEQTQRLAAAAEKLRDAQLAAAKGDAKAGEMKANAEKALASAAQDLADKLASGTATEKEKQDASKALQKAADQASGDPQAKQSLESAAKSAAGGDGKQLAQDLKDAGNRIAQQSSERAMSGDSLREAMKAADEGNNPLGGGEPQASSGSNPGEQNGASSPKDGSGQENKDGTGNGGNPQDGTGGQQQASGNEGNGAKEGNSAGPGEQPGAGQANSGAGDGPKEGTGNGGSTNLEGRSGPGDITHDPTVTKTGTFVKVYESHETANAGEKVKPPSTIDTHGVSAGAVDVKGPADNKDGHLVPYEQQVRAAGQRALEDMQTQKIPPQYRDLIHEYYKQ